MKKLCNEEITSLPLYVPMFKVQNVAQQHSRYDLTANSVKFMQLSQY